MDNSVRSVNRAGGRDIVVRKETKDEGYGGDEVVYGHRLKFRQVWFFEVIDLEKN